MITDSCTWRRVREEQIYMCAQNIFDGAITQTLSITNRMKRLLGTKNSHVHQANIITDKHYNIKYTHEVIKQNKSAKLHKLYKYCILYLSYTPPLLDDSTRLVNRLVKLLTFGRWKTNISMQRNKSINQPLRFVWWMKSLVFVYFMI